MTYRLSPGLLLAVFLWACDPPKPQRGVVIDAFEPSVDTSASEPDQGIDPEDVAPPPIETGLVTGPAYLDAALKLVDSAENRIDLVAFVIYDSGPVHTLLDHLIEAQARGVTVRVLADEEAENTVSALERLSNAGIETQVDSPEVTTHNKLLIADEVALLGSHNLSPNALERNVEVSLTIAQGEVAEYFRRYVDQLWQNSTQDPTVERPQITGVHPIKNREIAPALLQCISEAQDRIQLLLYAMTYNRDYPDSDPIRLVDELVSAQARGVAVDVLLDGSHWIRSRRINADAIDVLRSGGVSVRRTDADGVNHAKSIACDDRLIVSDANWSYSGLTLYNGTSIALYHPDVMADFRNYFRGIWDRAEPVP